MIPEGIAYDAVSKAYFAGSVASLKIVRVDSTGRVSDLSRSGELHRVLGLVVDGPHRRLHAVSTSALVQSAEKPKNEIVSYDLDTGAKTRSVAVAAAISLNDVTVAPSGDVYTTDTPGGAVYHIDMGGAVDTLVAPGSLPGANGLAFSADGTMLFVAHSTGIGRVTLANRAVRPRIGLPPHETIAAVDGLYRDGDALIGVQNTINPGRVIRMELAGDSAVVRVETLAPLSTPRP